MTIKELLKMNIEEEVPLVIKAGDQDLELEQKEISQYIVTRQIESHLEKFLENYKLPSTDKIGVWISGFFGSGKSYFAKILGYLLSNHTLPRGITARELFNERVASCANPEFIKASISALNSIPAEVVMFEIIGEGSMTGDTVQQVMFKKLLQAGGYSGVPTVAIMEYELDTFGHLDEIKEYVKTRNADYGRIVTNTGEFRRYASGAMKELGYSPEEADDFLKSAVDKYENLTPVDFAEHCAAYAKKTEKRLVFIIDETGQYVTSIKDNDDRILALQAVAEAFSSKGQGSVRLIVTSQEKLDQLIANSNFDKRKLGKLTDRFEIRLDLTSENVDEVARERLLKKKIEAEPLFEKTLRENQGNINTISDTNGSYKKTETKDQFMNYYPFHPYQFQLIPDFVQNARGASYQQATARKFIFLVDSILKNLKDEEFGRMVNATDLFDALGTGFFGAEVIALVKSADDYMGENVKASDILKALYILKNLTKIGASETVITRMLCKNIFDRQYELSREVKDALDYLEKTKYITRYNGEINLVTDLEREFIKEMENTVIDIPKRNEEIVRQLQSIFNYKEVQYADGPSVPLEWLFENNSIVGKKKGLKVSVSPFTGVSVEGPEFESMNHNDTVYLIP
ncbi:MAG TPA: BREX system P-loop protein BrxC, partial [Mesotoga sp.]|nr:BREX system P-loop protein BrxC [Mesotoga sp.]